MQRCRASTRVRCVDTQCTHALGAITIALLGGCVQLPILALLYDFQWPFSGPVHG